MSFLMPKIPKPPPLPEVPPPPPAPPIKPVEASLEKAEEERQRRKRGVSSTILTGPASGTILSRSDAIDAMFRSRQINPKTLLGD